MYIYKAAVVGAGTMGAEIAQVISYSGLPVILMDVNEKGVQQGIQKARKLYQARVDKGKMTPEELEQKMALILPATNYDGFGEVDIVIEAVTEEIDIKKRVFQALDAACPETTILATNTSALSITALSVSTRRPDKVIGIHFFNPAHVMKLVEVIPGLGTSPETLEDVIAFVEGLRKIAVRVQECAGFLVNRLLMPYLNEATLSLQEGAAAIKEMDEAMTSFGMPMGPFTLADLVGLDVAEKVSGILFESYGPRMNPASLLGEMVKAGRLGTKVGKGFYNYEGEGDTAVQSLIEKVQRETGVKRTTFTPHRLLLPMINEAAICLQEGVASAGDIDMAMMAGTGFPQAKGGPLHYADKIGIDTVLSELQRLKGELGFRFWPAPMLKRMVLAGYLGVKAGRGFFQY
jgi:3-hydroxyacyl-CoA dehydrogenase